MEPAASKQQITVILESTAQVIDMPWHLAPFKVTRVHFGSRMVLSVEFSAYDCNFIPGGVVEVEFRKSFAPVVFDARVLEIRKFDTCQIISNRRLCPKCHHLSLKPDEDEPIHGTARMRCVRNGCGGSSIR